MNQRSYKNKIKNARSFFVGLVSDHPQNGIIQRAWGWRWVACWAGCGFNCTTLIFVTYQIANHTPKALRWLGRWLGHLPWSRCWSCSSKAVKELSNALSVESISHVLIVGKSFDLIKYKGVFMKSLILVSLLFGSLAQAGVDYQCMSNCQATNPIGSFEYNSCPQRCTIQDTYVRPKQLDVQCQVDCTGKGYSWAYCNTRCSY